MANFTVIDGGMSRAKIAELLTSYKFNFSDEKQLQQGIAGVLEVHNIPFEREVTLSAKDIIDFMIGKIGLEVKIQESFADVARQLHRYAQLEEIDELILVTTKSQHQMPAEINGKKVTVVNLGLVNL